MPDRRFQEDMIEASEFLTSLRKELLVEEQEECVRLKDSPPKMCDAIRVGVIGAFAEMVGALARTCVEAARKDAAGGSDHASEEHGSPFNR